MDETTATDRSMSRRDVLGSMEDWRVDELKRLEDMADLEHQELSERLAELDRMAEDAMTQRDTEAFLQALSVAADWFQSRPVIALLLSGLLTVLVSYLVHGHNVVTKRRELGYRERELGYKERELKLREREFDLTQNKTTTSTTNDRQSPHIAVTWIPDTKAPPYCQFRLDVANRDERSVGVRSIFVALPGVERGYGEVRIVKITGGKVMEPFQIRLLPSQLCEIFVDANDLAGVPISNRRNIMSYFGSVADASFVVVFSTGETFPVAIPNDYKTYRAEQHPDEHPPERIRFFAKSYMELCDMAQKAKAWIKRK